MRTPAILLLLLLWLPAALPAQTCANQGQTPATAFPVCGTAVFTQQTVPLCGGRKLPSPACAGEQLEDINPYYYKFTCFEEGTLGFSIVPKTGTDDYDWEVYDITGRDPNDIFTDGSIVISSNWSGEGGETGAGTRGSQRFVCAGFGKPLWSAMPQLTKGHQYLLLVSHFTNSQSGYDLAFKGGTAVITDPLPPAMQEATAHCNAQVVRIKLNKKLRCNSLAADGSDFVILPTNHPVVGAVSLQCGNAFDTDSIEVRLARPLDPGTYQVAIRKGRDNNTLLDFCDNSVPEGQTLSFAVKPSLPTRLDSVAPVGCAPARLQLVFQKPVFCNTVAADGSDFVVQGPDAVIVRSASGACTGGVSRVITLQLAAPIKNGGQYKVVLRRNLALVDECGNPIPEGSVTFSVADTVNAAFTHQITYGCSVDQVQYRHPGGRGITRWQWSLDEGLRSSEQNPLANYTEFNTKQVQLIVANSLCADTARVAIPLINNLTANFSTVAEICPNEPIAFAGVAEGRGLQHRWNFGDGGTAATQQAVHAFVAPVRTLAYSVQYTVVDSFGCSETVTRPVRVYSSCTVYVPTAFTPGGDGRNDLFRPLNTLKADAYTFTVYNRWGEQVFTTRDPRKGWDGTQGGLPQGSGTYIWMLRYTDTDSGKVVERKGSVVLLR